MANTLNGVVSEPLNSLNLFLQNKAIKSHYFKNVVKGFWYQPRSLFLEPRLEFLLFRSLGPPEALLRLSPADNDRVALLSWQAQELVRVLHRRASALSASGVSALTLSDRRLLCSPVLTSTPTAPGVGRKEKRNKKGYD